MPESKGWLIKKDNSLEEFLDTQGLTDTQKKAIHLFLKEKLKTSLKGKFIDGVVAVILVLIFLYMCKIILPWWW